MSSPMGIGVKPDVRSMTNVDARNYLLKTNNLYYEFPLFSYQDPPCNAYLDYLITNGVMKAGFEAKKHTGARPIGRKMGQAGGETAESVLVRYRSNPLANASPKGNLFMILLCIAFLFFVPMDDIIGDSDIETYVAIGLYVLIGLNGLALLAKFFAKMVKKAAEMKAQHEEQGELFTEDVVETRSSEEVSQLTTNSTNISPMGAPKAPPPAFFLILMIICVVPMSIFNVPGFIIGIVAAYILFVGLLVTVAVKKKQQQMAQHQGAQSQAVSFLKAAEKGVSLNGIKAGGRFLMFLLFAAGVVFIVPAAVEFEGGPEIISLVAGSLTVLVALVTAKKINTLNEGNIQKIMGHFKGSGAWAFIDAVVYLVLTILGDSLDFPSIMTTMFPIGAGLCLIVFLGSVGMQAALKKGLSEGFSTGGQKAGGFSMFRRPAAGGAKSEGGVNITGVKVTGRFFMFLMFLAGVGLIVPSVIEYLDETEPLLFISMGFGIITILIAFASIAEINKLNQERLTEARKGLGGTMFWLFVEIIICTVLGIIGEDSLAFSSLMGTMLRIEAGVIAFIFLGMIGVQGMLKKAQNQGFSTGESRSVRGVAVVRTGLGTQVPVRRLKVNTSFQEAFDGVIQGNEFELKTNIDSLKRAMTITFLLLVAFAAVGYLLEWYDDNDFQMIYIGVIGVLAVIMMCISSSIAKEMKKKPFDLTLVYWGVNTYQITTLGQMIQDPDSKSKYWIGSAAELVAWGSTFHPASTVIHITISMETNRVLPRVNECTQVFDRIKQSIAKELGTQPVNYSYSVNSTEIAALPIFAWKKDKLKDLANRFPL